MIKKNRIPKNFSTNPLFLIDINGKITSFNYAAEVVTGIINDKLLDSFFPNLFTEPAKVSKMLQQVLSKGIINNFSLSLYSGKGVANDIIINAFFYTGKSGESGKVFVTANSTIEHEASEKIIIANKELTFQNEEKEKRAAELIIANKELAFQNEEKEKRAAELIIANKELTFQNEEKEKRAAELIIANKELAFQNEEKEKRAAELILANKELTQSKEQLVLLASIVKYSEDAIFSKTLEGIITAWNNGAEKTYGYSSKEIIGKHISVLIPDHLQQEENGIMEKIRRGEIVEHYETIRIKKNGSLINVSLTVSPVKDYLGNITGASKISRDITENKKAEETIAATLKEKNIILESIGDAFFAVDKNWTVTYWNRIAESALSKLKYEIVGKNLWEIFSGSINSVSYIKYHEALATKEVVHFEDYYILLQKWYEISAYPSENGLSVYFKDVTERHKAAAEIKNLNTSLEEKVIQRTGQLKKSNEELESFSYSISHDLRAPLRAINGYAKILEEDYNKFFDTEGKRLLNEVQNNAKRMGMLIADLLAFSRLGKKEIEKSFIDMNKLAESVIREVNQSTPNTAEIKVSNLLPVMADHALLQQVMINLFSNAVKYSSKKEKPVITIQSNQENGEIVYAVSDNGEGFNMEYVHKLFGVFQRLHSNEEFTGTGVGLAIVKRIINKHNGKIWAEGKIGEGATFYFTLPEK